MTKRKVFFQLTFTVIKEQFKVVRILIQDLDPRNEMSDLNPSMKSRIWTHENEKSDLDPRK